MGRPVVEANVPFLLQRVLLYLHKRVLKGAENIIEQFDLIRLNFVIQNATSRNFKVSTLRFPTEFLFRTRIKFNYAGLSIIHGIYFRKKVQ